MCDYVTISIFSTPNWGLADTGGHVTDILPHLSLGALAGMMSHPPIPINELAEHIELLKANDNLRLSQEYEVRDL